MASHQVQMSVEEERALERFSRDCVEDLDKKNGEGWCDSLRQVRVRQMCYERWNKLSKADKLKFYDRPAAMAAPPPPVAVGAVFVGGGAGCGDTDAKTEEEELTAPLKAEDCGGEKPPTEDQLAMMNDLVATAQAKLRIGADPTEGVVFDEDIKKRTKVTNEIKQSYKAHQMANRARKPPTAAAAAAAGDGAAAAAAAETAVTTGLGKKSRSRSKLVNPPAAAPEPEFLNIERKFGGKSKASKANIKAPSGVEKEVKAAEVKDQPPIMEEEDASMEGDQGDSQGGALNATFTKEEVNEVTETAKEEETEMTKAANGRKAKKAGGAETAAEKKKTAPKGRGGGKKEAISKVQDDEMMDEEAKAADEGQEEVEGGKKPKKGRAAKKEVVKKAAAAVEGQKQVATFVEENKGKEGQVDEEAVAAVTAAKTRKPRVNKKDAKVTMEAEKVDQANDDGKDDKVEVSADDEESKETAKAEAMVDEPEKEKESPENVAGRANVDSAQTDEVVAEVKKGRKGRVGGAAAAAAAAKKKADDVDKENAPDPAAATKAKGRGGGRKK